MARCRLDVQPGRVAEEDEEDEEEEEVSGGLGLLSWLASGGVSFCRLVRSLARSFVGCNNRQAPSLHWLPAGAGVVVVGR